MYTLENEFFQLRLIKSNIRYLDDLFVLGFDQVKSGCTL